jgi:hypothetical protein
MRVYVCVVSPPTLLSILFTDSDSSFTLNILCGLLCCAGDVLCTRHYIPYILRTINYYYHHLEKNLNTYCLSRLPS